MFNLTPTVRTLLIANIVLFLAQEYLPLHITEIGSLYPIGSPYFFPWQFVTYMFLHANWGHIISNMFGLISFGPLLEMRWGAQRFLLFWMICGVGAGGLYEGVRAYEIHRMYQDQEQIVTNPTGVGFATFVRAYEGGSYYEQDDLAGASALQRNPNDTALRESIRQRVQEIYQAVTTSQGGGMLGASGALFGILFAFAYLFPNTELMLLFFPFPIKAKYFVFFYALYELYGGVHRAPGDNVAHFAHLGGLLIGFIVLKVWERGRERFY